MKIGIVGGGSIGLLFAYYLNQYHEVVLYVRTNKQKNKIQTDGLLLKKGTKTLQTNIETRLVSEWGRSEKDLSIICVKQYQLSSLLEQASISEGSPLLFLQNGMGHLNLLEKLPFKRVFVGSVEHGALKVSENNVFHTGEGLTKLAKYKGESEDLLCSLIESCKETFPFQFEEDYYEMLLKKLVVNSIINPLTAVLKVENGVLLDNPYFFELMNQLFGEIEQVLELRDGEQYYKNVIAVCKKTGKNRSSMLKDLEEKRKTEIDAILGYVIDEAKRKQLEAPLVHTYYQCIKGIELVGEGK